MVTEMLPEVVGADPSEKRPRRRRLMVIAWLPSFWWAESRHVRCGRGARRTYARGPRWSAREGMAARYGIDITLIGVTAAGGLIEFRYQVVDPDKANPIIHDLRLCPKLVVEDTGATLALRSLPHSIGAVAGAGWDLLLPAAPTPTTPSMRGPW